MNNKFFRFFRSVALLAAFSLFAVLIFEAFHAGHEEVCHEEDCPICLLLQVISSTNKITNPPQLKSIEFSTFSYINLLILSVLFFSPATLVKQKVKLVI